MKFVLPELPSSWSPTRLDHVATVNARIGWKALTASEYIPEGYAFLSTPNIKGNEIDFENVNYIDEFRFEESPELKLQKGDVLLVKDGNTLGITNVVAELPRPATVNGSIAVIRTDTLEPRFLRYALASDLVQDMILAVKAGMGVPHLFQGDIKKFPLPRPPRPVQQAIADYLDRETARIDALVVAKQQMMDLLGERWAAIRYCFTRPDSWNWSSRVQLRRVARLQAGAAFPHERQGDPGGTIPYVKVGDLSDVDDHDQLRGASNRVSPEVAMALRSPVLPAGTIVLPKIGAALLTNRRAILSEPSCLDQNVMGVTVKAGNPRFVYHCLSAIDLGKLSTPGPVPLLNEDAGLSVRIPWPSMEEQDRIVDAVDRYKELIHAPTALLARQIALLQERRQALVTAAVTGQLGIPEAT